MEVPYNKARAEYLQMLDERIDPLLQGCEELRALLLEELGMDRFVAKEWNGIVGFKHLDIQMRENFLDAHKVKSQHINPRLF